MPYTPRLDILRQLREERRLSQAEMARLCGLHGKQSQQTVGAWERGEIVPGKARRGAMMRYLWDGLLLRQEPAQFEKVWEVFVDVWKWEPISAQEWREFSHQPRPQAPDKLDQQRTRLETLPEHVTDMALETEPASTIGSTGSTGTIGTSGAAEPVGLRSDRLP